MTGTGQLPTVAVLGGTGNFGRRICRRLAKTGGIRLIVTSRRQDRADELAAELSLSLPAAPGTEIVAAAIDQNDSGFGESLRRLAPAVVVHTAGPYQGQDYRVARACIDARCHYVDLADGRRFVADFAGLDAEARDAGVLLIAGASTLPGISTAVIDDFRGEFDRIDSIETSITPAHRTPRGLGTVGAVLSYCGKPLATLRDGERRTVHGWQDLRMQRYPQLGRRLSAACDVPDLALLPDYVPGVSTVSFHAALEAFWEHAGLWIMAAMSRLGLVRDWSRHAQPLWKMSSALTFAGSDRGGMHMRLAGRAKSGARLELNWYMTADDNHGPEIPCTPAIVLALKLAHGELADRGAKPCLGMVTPDEVMASLAGFSISTQTVREG